MIARLRREFRSRTRTLVSFARTTAVGHPLSGPRMVLSLESLWRRWKQLLSRHIAGAVVRNTMGVSGFPGTRYKAVDIESCEAISLGVRTEASAEGVGSAFDRRHRLSHRRNLQGDCIRVVEPRVQSFPGAGLYT